MSGELDTRLFELSAELEGALQDGMTIDLAAIAVRFQVEPEQVACVAAALQAVQQALGEDLDARAPLAPPELPDDYELGAEIGRGGMGVVYRAHQRSLDRDVAVKVLRPGDLVFGDAIARFEREARNLARLRHRHIVRVHEVGRANGHVYFTMDLVEGKSLQRAIADGEMTIGRAVKLVRQVCSAIAFAHGRGIVHRDLKPANVLVDGDDDAFVVDFGLARDLGAVGDATLSGQLFGTPAYMSPEQALGDRAHIGEASDIYAIGAILYECLGGKPPFHGLPLARLMHAVVTDEPEPLRRLEPRVPRDLAVICGKAMQKQPLDRYATVQALAEDLERFAIGKEILARPQRLTARAARFAQRHRLALLAGAVPVLAVLAAMWGLVVPGLLRGHRLELADRLYAEGNIDGARLAYADAADNLDLDHAVRFADCLLDRAAQAQCAGREPEAKADLARVRELLRPPTSYRHRLDLTRQLSPDQLADLAYATAKLHAIADEPRWPNDLRQETLARRVSRDLAGAGRDAALLVVLAATRRDAGNLAHFGAPAVIVPALLERRRHLPAGLQEWFDVSCTGIGDRLLGLEYRDPELERALVAVARDRDRDPQARKDAAGLLHCVGAFPFLRECQFRAFANGSTHVYLVSDAALDTLGARYDSLRGLDRLARFDACIQFVVDELAEPFTPNPKANDRLRDRDLWHWLESHAGSWPRSADQLRDWWAGLRDQDPRARLLAALGWDLRPDQLTPALLLQRIHAPEVAGHLLWVHQLLVLTVGDDVRVPNESARLPDLVPRWERALQAVPTARYILRVATLGFVGGGPTPRLLWQQALTLGIDEQRTWSVRAPQQLVAAVALGCGRQVEYEEALVCSGSASLRWTRDGVVGAVNAQTILLTHAAAQRGQYGGDHDLRPGAVMTCSGENYLGTDGLWWADVLTLAHLEPETAATATWQVADWQRALAVTVEGLDQEGAVAAYNRGAAFVAAGFLPLPAQREALARIDAAVRQQPFLTDDLWGEARRRARLLAGDQDAAAAAVAASPWDTDDRITSASQQAFAVRQLLTTDTAARREELVERLGAAPLLPAFARTLDRAAAAGAPLPDRLAARVRGTPSLVAAGLRDALAMLVALMLLALATMASLVGALVRRGRSWGRTCAVLLFCGGLALSQCYLWIGATQYLPAWPGFALSAVATWLGCWRAARGWLHWLAPLWWTTVCVMRSLGQLPPEHADTAWGIGVVLLAMSWWRRSAAAHTTSRQPSAARGPAA